MGVHESPALLRAVLREDFGVFIAKTFATVSPGDVYAHNWHIDAIAHALREVHAGRETRLLITQPPRSLKSICTSVAYVAWALGHDPTLRIACVSYSAELGAALARQFRSVVTSDWHRALFPGFRLAKDTEIEAVTTKGGGRFMVPVGGSFTGRGADLILIDDPMKADDAPSDRARRAVVDWYRGVLLSRLDDKQTGAIVLVMQRLHEDDLAGVLLREADEAAAEAARWRHLDLPAIAVADQDVPIGPNAVHHRKEGEVLHPEREPRAVLDQLKVAMGSLAFSAQYQQRPTPLEGNLIKRAWIRSYDALPDHDTTSRVIQSWDFATALGPANDYSVCTTWLEIATDYYLVDLWRGRLDYPSLRRKVMALAETHRPNRVLMEDDGAGRSLNQEFQCAWPSHVARPLLQKPDGDKVTRLAAGSARFEAGQVRLPRSAPWLADLLEELLAFPNGRHDDQVDSVSQFLNYVSKPRRRPGVW